MIFALKNSRFQRYIDSTIIKPVLLEAKEKEITVFAKAIKETQNKIDFWIKDKVRALGKIDQMYNKIVQLRFDVTWLSSKTWSKLKTKYLLNKQLTK